VNVRNLKCSVRIVERENTNLKRKKKKMKLMVVIMVRQLHTIKHRNNETEDILQEEMC